MSGKESSAGSSPGHLYLALLVMNDICARLLEEIANRSQKPSDLDAKEFLREQIKLGSYLSPELELLRALLHRDQTRLGRIWRAP